MWTNPQETADLLTFTEEILNEKLHFLWVHIFQKYLQQVGSFDAQIAILRYKN